MSANNGRPAKKVQPKPRISEGVRQDIEINGWAIDPNTGRKLTKDDIEQGEEG